MAYSIGERYLRTAFFQFAVQENGWLENALIKTYLAFEQATLCPEGIEKTRAERGLQFFLRLGADFSFITPKDQMARIHRMRLDSLEIKRRIQELGGEWKKIETIDSQGESKSLLAIFPPSHPSEKWSLLEKALLRLWKKESITIDEEEKDILVTCRCAELIDESRYHSQIFIHANSGSVIFAMLLKRIALYLGCMQSIAFFDPRGNGKSEGLASEGGYYNDLEAVFAEAAEMYDDENIWVTSTCGGCPSAASLKIRASRKVNFIFENTFMGLENFQDSRFGRWFIQRYQNGLLARDMKEEHKPKETYFRIEDLWENLAFSEEGKVIIIKPSNDERLKPEIGEQFEALVHRTHRLVNVIPFHSENPNTHHGDRYFNYFEPTKEVLRAIFK